MKSPKTFLLLGTVLGIFLLSIAYAAIQNITLTVNGTATVTPDQSNFDVEILEADAQNWFQYGDDIKIETSRSSDKKSITVVATNLKKIGDGFSFCPIIENNSTDLDAAISTTYEIAGDEEYFEINIPNLNFQYDYDGYLEAGKSSYIDYHKNDDFVVKLKKLPIEKDVTVSVTFTITAEPVN